MTHDPLRMCAIPEHFRGVFMTRWYTNARLPLPLPLHELILQGVSYCRVSIYRIHKVSSVK